MNKDSKNQIESNYILCADTIKQMKQLPDECIDLIFADPPYWMRVEGALLRIEGSSYDGCDDVWDNQFKSNNDYNDFTKEWLLECKRILKKNGSIWVIGSMQCIYSIGALMQELDFWFINDVIWQKKNPTPNFMGTRLNNSHETLIWATKSKKSKFTFNYKTAKELNCDTVEQNDFDKGIRKQLGSVWKIGICQGSERIKDSDGNKLHSTQKPEELLYRIINISSNLNDIVFDPFGGTFTTATVAKKCGRKYISFDSNEKYVEYGQKRIAQALEKITDIEKALFDKKPTKVSLVQMIEDNYFFEEEIFYLKNSETKANLLKNGKIRLNNEEIDIHSGAAKAKKVSAARLNGFEYWFVERNSELISIKDIRALYRKEKFGE